LVETGFLDQTFEMITFLPNFSLLSSSQLANTKNKENNIKTIEKLTRIFNNNKRKVSNLQLRSFLVVVGNSRGDTASCRK